MFSKNSLKVLMLYVSLSLFVFLLLILPGSFSEQEPGPAPTGEATAETGPPVSAEPSTRYFRVEQVSMSPLLQPGDIIELGSAACSDGDLVVALKADGTHVVKVLQGDMLVPLGAGVSYGAAEVTILGKAELSALTAAELEAGGIGWGSVLAETAVEPAEGDGSEGNPYEIATWQNLYWISQDTSRWNKHYLQTADIVFPDNINTWDGGDGWTPIGRSVGITDDPFLGVYDGGQFTISGLYFNRTQVQKGFFGVLGSGAVVKNVGLVNVNVTGSGSIGALVGLNNGTVSNSYATGNVTGNGVDVGGLVGYSGGTVTNSYATASVNGDNRVGGLVGLNINGTIENSYATGSVTGTGNDVGGLVGWNDGASAKIENSYATGNVTGTGVNVGGLVGQNSDGTVTGSFYDQDTTGRSDTGKGEPKTTAEMKTQNTFTDAGWNFTDTWAMSSPIAFGGYPTLQWTGGYAEAPTSNQITSLPNLVWVAENSSRWAGSYTQTADISMWTTPSWDGGKGWRPIGNSTTNFTGTYNGGGHTISGLFINRDGESILIGLFGCTGTAATLTNTGLKNATVVTGDGVAKISFIGGLVGKNMGRIENCYITGGSVNTTKGKEHDTGGLVGRNENGTIINSYATVSVTGQGDVGGLVGSNNNGTIKDSYATGDVSGITNVGGLVGSNDSGTIENSYATGDVSGTSDRVGGLAGFNIGASATVTNSYATGGVTGNNEVGGLVGFNTGASATITNCYATGSVTGQENVGGLVGSNDGTVTNSYWNTDSYTGSGIGSGTTTGATGKTAAEMKTLAFHQNDLGWGAAITTTEETVSRGGYDPYPFPRLFWELDNSAPPTWYIYGVEPKVTSVNPDSGTQGQTLAAVTITGTNFTGATAVSFSAGITINSFTVNSATQVTTNITIAANAATGARDVSVTTPAGTGTLNSGFTVNAAPSPPPTPPPPPPPPEDPDDEPDEDDQDENGEDENDEDDNGDDDQELTPEEEELNDQVKKSFPGHTVAFAGSGKSNQGESNGFQYNNPFRRSNLIFSLGWGGSEMELAVYRPDGSLYQKISGTTPPLIMEVKNAEKGVWAYEVTAINIPHDNYPFNSLVGYLEDWVIIDSPEEKVPLDTTWEVTLNEEYTVSDIAGMAIEKNNHFIPVTIDLLPGAGQASITPFVSYQPGSSYNLRILLNDGRRYLMPFQTVEVILSYLPQLYGRGRYYTSSLMALHNPEDIYYNNYYSTDGLVKVIPVNKLADSSRFLTKSEAALLDYARWLSGKEGMLADRIVSSADNNWKIIEGLDQQVPLETAWRVNFNRSFEFEQIDAMVIMLGDSFIPVTIQMLPEEYQAIIIPAESYQAGEKYSLRMFLNNMKRYKLIFNTTEAQN